MSPTYAEPSGGIGGGIGDLVSRVCPARVHLQASQNSKNRIFNPLVSSNLFILQLGKMRPQEGKRNLPQPAQLDGEWLGSFLHVLSPEWVPSTTTGVIGRQEFYGNWQGRGMRNSPLAANVIALMPPEAKSSRPSWVSGSRFICP